MLALAAAHASSARAHARAVHVRSRNQTASVPVTRRTLFALLALSALAPVAAGDLPVWTYGSPEEVARCVAWSCSVYAASMTEIGPLRNSGPAIAPAAMTRRAVTLRVDAVYAGPLKPGEVVIRDYVTPVDNSLGELSGGSDAWRDVPPLAGSAVLLVESPAGGDVILVKPVASAAAAKLRALAQLNARVASNPVALQAAANAVDPRSDPYRAAYLVIAAFARLKPDFAVPLLTTLVEKDGFSPSYRAGIMTDLGFTIFHADDEVRQAAIARLLHVAAAPDFDKARPVLSHLLFTYSHTPFPLPALNPAVAARLRKNYDTLTAPPHQRDAKFEAALRLAAEAGAK